MWEAEREEARQEEARAREVRAELVASLDVAEGAEAWEVTDEEVEAVIWGGDAWKAPDTHGVQMGFIRAGWPAIGGRVCQIFKVSVHLGLYPTPLKSSNAIPTAKAGKKDKTSPKAYRPVEQHAEALAKPLERLIANRISYEAETRGLLEED
jgi:hypothetical protein